MSLQSVTKLIRRWWRRVLSELASLVPSPVRRWFKWLAPGLLVKRWLFLSVVGVLLVGLGTAIALNLTPVFYTVEFLGAVLRFITTVFPSYITGPLAVLFGVGLILWGQLRTLGSITDVLLPNREDNLIDMLMTQRRLHRGPKVVALGGGTGLSTLLRGLKLYSANITAVVTVADDGGSSGRLRREVGILPPGDIRNCLEALAAEERLLTDLFHYRFQAGDGLSGHSFGNLFLTAMNDITGDLEQAIAASSKVLAVRGEVLPATLSDVRLWAELADGRRIEGESNITKAQGRVVNIGCTPANPPALPRAVKAIQKADYIIIGPGSLYTSIIPNLLIPGIREAIADSPVPRIYVCNIMTEPGETQEFTVADHIRAIDQACGVALFDAVLVQKKPPSPAAIARYSESGSMPVRLDRATVMESGRRIVTANVMEETPQTGVVRHHPQRLAQVLLRWYARTQGF